jgi:hypothetical protein
MNDYAAMGRRSMASRNPQERSAFARVGSLTAARNGKQHRWTTATAREAGLKGVAARRQRAAR